MCALILKGGGVKGLAFAGAIQVLEQLGFSFNVFVGTSAGAITAVLLAGNYSGAEIESALRRQDFRRFLDNDGRIKQLWRLLTKGWIHSGDAIVQWLERLLHFKKRGRVSDEKITLRELSYRVVLYASRRSGGEIVFDSQGKRADYSASVAARYSASIPGFFRAEQYENEPIYDGGVLNNFPVDIFRRDNPDVDFIAINLTGDKSKGAQLWLLRWPLVRVLVDVINIQLKQREPQILDAYPRQIININTGNIGATDFGLDDAQKDFLVAAGRAGALQFVAKHHPEKQLPAELLIEAMENVAELSKELKAKRQNSRWVYNALAILGVMAATTVLLIFAPDALTRAMRLGPNPQLVEVYPRSLEYQPDLTHYMNNAHDELFMVAVNLFVTLPHQQDELVKCIRKGLNVKILIFDPNSPNLPELAISGERDATGVRNNCLDTIKRLRIIQKRVLNDAVASEHTGSLQIKVFKNVLHMRTYFFDPRSSHGVMLINPYVNAAAFQETPAFLFRDPQSLPYSNYLSAMNILWQRSTDFDSYIKSNSDIDSLTAGTP